MKPKRAFRTTLVAVAFLCIGPMTSPAQGPETAAGAAEAVSFVVPQVRKRSRGHEREVRVESVRADVSIDDLVATTSLELTLWNPGSTPREAQVLLPVPEGVSVRSMQYDGTGVEPTAKLLPRDEARSIYDSIVRRARDPALLEFAGFNLIKSSVFPVPAGVRQRVTIVYEQVLERDGNRIDYALPRSQSLEPLGIAWEATVRIRSATDIASVYSPSHDLVVEHGARQATARFSDRCLAAPGALRLSVVLRTHNEHELWGSVITCPDLDGDPDKGYFMLVTGAPSGGASTSVKREVVLVFDRSGSMRGAKLEQARAAAVQVVEGLREGEYFNIIDYSDTVASFAPAPVRKDGRTAADAREYLRVLSAGGGTNIGDALLEALRPEPVKGALPMVLFLTDGLPTVGERSEIKIRESVERANVHARRVFTFGIGFDVNAPLLNAVSRITRGAGTFVLPEEDVESKVSHVFRRLDGPLMQSPTLSAETMNGTKDSRFLRDVEPGRLPDIFCGDQTVIVGRWIGKDPHRIVIKSAESRSSVGFDILPSSASLRNSHVARLWASRRIAALLDEVHAMGASGTPPSQDPRFKELVDEVVLLSTKFGVLTEYTAFLATEPGVEGVTPVTRGSPVPMAEAASRARDELGKKSMIRAGSGGVAQQLNVNAQRETARAPAQQSYIDADMREQRLGGVQQMADSTLFFRAGRWVESSLLAQEQEAPERTVEFDTPEFTSVLTQLVAEGRQGLLARGGDVYLRLQGQRVLVRCP